MPNASDRVLLRRFMMGGVPWVKSNLAKRCGCWDEVPDHVKKDMMQCGCQGGVQDVEHMWWECQMMKHTRMCVLQCADNLVDEYCSGSEKVMWNGMSEKERLLHSVGVRKLFTDGLERKLKSQAAKLWVDGFTMFASRLEKENCDFKYQAEECVLGFRG